MSSGTPAFPTMLPRNWKAAATRASARPRSRLTASRQAWRRSFPGFIPAASILILWFPIPGVQTLNFTPYRVNLTPFAGLLSNGQPHTVSLSVYNADNYFSATASLLLYTDPGSTQTSGAITENTLTGPSPVVTENLNVQPTSITGHSRR